MGWESGKGKIIEGRGRCDSVCGWVGRKGRKEGTPFPKRGRSKLYTVDLGKHGILILLLFESMDVMPNHMARSTELKPVLPSISNAIPSHVCGPRHTSELGKKAAFCYSTHGVLVAMG